MNKTKHKLFEKEHYSLEKKNEERLKKIDFRRKQLDEKLKIESQIRNEKYINAKLKNEELIKEREDKYLEKQKNIEKFQEFQKKKRNNY